MSIELSVVVPMKDEQEVLPLLTARLRPVLDGLTTTYEVVFVDDGSRDLTPALLMKLARDWPQVRVVRLRANAGHQAAISAGLEVADGDYVVTIDADLQDPPEVIPDMLATARREEVDVVYGVRADRSADSLFKRTTARAFYAMIRTISGTSAHSDAGDFRLMSRATVDAVNQLPQANRVLRFVVPALEFPSASVEYKREERAAGTSKYPFVKMLRLSLDSVTGFSLFPLRLATYLGLGGAALIALASVVLLFAARSGTTIPGWTSTVLVVAGVGAVQLLCLGLLGEYVGRMYTQMQGRPAYFIASDSKAPVAKALDGKAADTTEPDSTASNTMASNTMASNTMASNTMASNTMAPSTMAPNTMAPNSLAPSRPSASGADLPVAFDDPLGRRQLR